MPKDKRLSSSPIATTTWTGYTVVDPAELVKSEEFQEFLEFLRLYRSELIPDTVENVDRAIPASRAEAGNGASWKR